MDKRTRVLNALNKEEVDHVPVGFWFHFAGEEAVGDACVKAHLRDYRETDLDKQMTFQQTIERLTRIILLYGSRWRGQRPL